MTMTSRRIVVSTGIRKNNGFSGYLVDAWLICRAFGITGHQEVRQNTKNWLSRMFVFLLFRRFMRGGTKKCPAIPRQGILGTNMSLNLEELRIRRYDCRPDTLESVLVPISKP